MDVRRAIALSLSIFAVALRLCAIGLCAIAALLCFNGIASQLNLVGFVVDLSRSMPTAIAGYGVLTTPFGGVFRFDFVLAALLLFLIDYACVRASRFLLTPC